MKKKLLLKIKKWILTLRKAYASKKDLITDFIHADNLENLSGNPVWEAGMDYFNAKDIDDIKLAVLDVNRELYTVDEYILHWDYIQKSKKRKLAKENCQY